MDIDAEVWGDAEEVSQSDSETDEDSIDENEEAEEEELSSDAESDQGPSMVQEDSAEQEIEGDFDRLVKNIRLQDSSSSSTNTGLLARQWDIDIEERDAEFKDDLRAASGIGRKRKKKSRIAGPTLSQQVKALIGDGNQAYVDSNLPEAIRIMQEVIRIEPRAASAWSVLAQCYADLHEDQKALDLRIMAAHLVHDADEWDRLARQSRERGYNQQALYCYRKVYSLDPTNVDALWERATLAKEMGELRTARNAYFAILKRFPHDLTVLRELHPILVELSELPTCATLLQGALDHYMKIYPSGHGNENENGFGRMDLLLLADLYNVLGEHEHAVDAIRGGTRWLQGRADQKFWYMCEDDREYDQEGWQARAGTGDGSPAKAGNYELDANARHRLAVARIRMGDFDEGKLHANVVLGEDVLDYSVLFAEIADAYFDKEMYAEAKPIYELLGGDPATSSVHILLQTAACMRNLDELRDAADVYEHVRLADPGNNDAKMKLAEVYEIMGEPRKALDLVYEVIDSRRKRRGPAPNPDDAAGGTASTSLFAEDKAAAKARAKQNRLSHAQLKELEVEKEKEVARSYRRLTELWSAMLAGEEDPKREWMVEAEKLVDMFRETRNLFLTGKTNQFRGMFPSRKKRNNESEADDEDRMASRLQLDLERDSAAKKSARSGEKTAIVNVFRGVSFEDWLRLFMQYCFNLTKAGHFQNADEILRHIMASNAYKSTDRQDTIRFALITCAITAQRHEIVVEQVRKLITQNQFNNEPLRILLASLSSGLRNTDAFISSTLQKHLFREVKLSDMAINKREELKWNSIHKRYVTVGQGKAGKEAKADGLEEGGEESDDNEADERGSVGVNEKSALPELPKKENPVIVTIYGQLCVAARSYQSAIFYLLHAYDYFPEDPVICLCLAIASIGRAMQRQSDNRHHLVIQGMAFLTKYRKLRGEGEDDKGVREVEYNFGRAFHQLGLYSYAVKHYERVLEIAETTEDDSFAREAAYNLSLIFVLTGATPFADALYRRWLSI